MFKQELDYVVTPLALDVQIDAVRGRWLELRRGDRFVPVGLDRDFGSAAIPAVFVARRTSQGSAPGRRDMERHA